jgi:hypothetical protein
MKNLSYKLFSDIALADVFFDSLKADYKEFVQWFERKAREGARAYAFFKSNGKLDGFLFLKIEEGVVDDVNPPLPAAKHLKIGTLKINAHGTKLGERFIKKVFDHALSEAVDDIYVTAFEKHEGLISLLKRYGFIEHAKKETQNGTEIVLLRNLREMSGDVLLDFPLISMENKSCHLLAIYPEYHTKFLPDSILNNESHDIVTDVSHTNSIHKVYISGIHRTNRLKRGDILLIYRTSDNKGPAFYRSVATSIGVVEEVRKIGSFASEAAFLKYAKPYSIFTNAELKNYYATRQRSYIIRFAYNAALTKRVTRGRLMEEVGLPAARGVRWDFLNLTNEQLRQIATMGEVNENIIVD